MTYNVEANNEFKANLINDGYEFTNKLDECIYILPCGTLLDGQFDCGSRGLDHNMIGGYNPYNRYDNYEEFWKYVHETLCLVRVVPETGVLLLSENQFLTAEQNDVVECLVDSFGFVIERY